MSFLYFLENLRTPLLNVLMLGITQFGSELVFLFAALILYWCVNKKYGYYLIGVGFLGILPNQVLKILCRVPRPWVLDPNFTIVEAARADAGGFSFPSGHSQSSVGTYGSIALLFPDKRVRIPAILLCILVPFSRMYLGVHTPADVLFSVFLALLLIFLLRPMLSGNIAPYLLIMAVLSTAAAVFLSVYPFPAGMVGEEFSHSLKNVYDLTGAAFGLITAYALDRKYLRFSESAPIGFQIFKVTGGILLLLGIKSVLKTPLNFLFGEGFLAEVLRYYLVILFAGFLWPWIFTAIMKKRGYSQ